MKLKKKIIKIPFFYNRAKLFNKFIELLSKREIKKFILLLLLDIVSKFFNDRSDYFDISQTLDAVYKEYCIEKVKVGINLRPLEVGLFSTHDPKKLNKKKQFLEYLSNLNLNDRTFLIQERISMLEYAVNGGSEKWFESKNKELKISKQNYPNLSNDAFLLGPEWYLSIGHISLLGYLGISYPKKFFLLKVKGFSSANQILFNIVSKNFKVLECSPLLFSSLKIAQPNLFHTLDSTRFSGNKNPLIDFVQKASSKLPNRVYKFKNESKKVSDYIKSDYLKGHTIFPEFVTIHVRSNLGDKPNDPNSPARNADIGSYEKAIRYLISKKLNVVRIGDYLSRGLPKINGFIDLTKYKRNNLEDIGLLAKAKFHIATPSGPQNVPPLFGVPVLLTNSVRPLIHPSYPLSFAISKRCFNYNINEFMKYSDFLNSEIVLEEMRRSFGNGLFLKDNTEKEILDAVKDMLKFTSLHTYDLRIKKFKFLLENYEKYLKINKVNFSQPHIPLSPTFLEIISKE